MDQKHLKFSQIPDIISRVPENGSSDFDLNSDVSARLPEGRKLRPAAVMLPLIDRPQGIHLILTKRASHLKHHPGQIALPGGKVDADDQDVIAAAIREASEEIGLPESNVGVIGTLPAHETITGFNVTPVVTQVLSPFVVKPEAGEVDEVFEVPLSFLVTPDNYLIEGRVWQGVRRYFYVAPYGPYYIWGATARMLRVFAEGYTKWAG